jgi:hypothetical protein
LDRPSLASTIQSVAAYIAYLAADMKLGVTSRRKEQLLRKILVVTCDEKKDSKEMMRGEHHGQKAVFFCQLK